VDATLPRMNADLLHPLRLSSRKRSPVCCAQPAAKRDSTDAAGGKSANMSLVKFKRAASTKRTAISFAPEQEVPATSFHALADSDFLPSVPSGQHQRKVFYSTSGEKPAVSAGGNRLSASNDTHRWLQAQPAAQMIAAQTVAAQGATQIAAQIAA